MKRPPLQLPGALLSGGVMVIVDEANSRVREFYGNLNTLNAYLCHQDVPNRQMLW